MFEMRFGGRACVAMDLLLVQPMVDIIIRPAAHITAAFQ